MSDIHDLICILLVHVFVLIPTDSLFLKVAQFLRVNPEAGLFFFDSSYRPVPLAQQYIGISEPNFRARIELQNEICYKKVIFYSVNLSPAVFSIMQQSCIINLDIFAF